MKKLIILLTLVALSFSADKWEYVEAIYTKSLVYSFDSKASCYCTCLIVTVYYKGCNRTNTTVL